MTIIVSVKMNDGIVVAADSAGAMPSGHRPHGLHRLRARAGGAERRMVARLKLSIG